MEHNVLDRMAVEFGCGFPLKENVVALGAIGSHSHGTYIPSHIDDVDYMGIVVPPPDYIIGLKRWEHWVYKKDEWDVVLYSADKMVRLLLKNNPNVMGFLWLPNYEVTSPWFDELVRNRHIFSSKLAYKTFVAYAMSQFHKMEHQAYLGYMGEKRKRLVEEFGYDCKNAAHLIRLMRMCIEFLETGQMNVYRSDREELKEIKQGVWSLERVKQEAEKLFVAASEALIKTKLPEEPDSAKAERLLMDLYMSKLAA